MSLEGSVAGKNILRQLSLVKGEERYVFGYRPGEEMDALGDMARAIDDETCSFNVDDGLKLASRMGLGMYQTVIRG